MKCAVSLGAFLAGGVSLVVASCGGTQSLQHKPGQSEPVAAESSKLARGTSAPHESPLASPDTPPPEEAPLSVRLVPQLGHGNGVQGISLSPNGKVAATASADKTLRVWDVNSGILLRVLPLGEQVYDVAILRDNHRAAVAGLYGLSLFDLATGARIFHEKTDQSRLRSLHRSDRLILADGGGGVALWNLDPPKLMRQLRPGRQGGKSRAEDVDVSPDDRLVAVAREDGSILLLELETGRLIRELTGHSGTIPAVRFLRNSGLLISFGADQTIRTWDIGSGRELGKVVYAQRIAAATLVDDEHALISGGGDSIAKVVRLSDGGVLRRLEPWPNVSLYRTDQLATSNDGKRAVLGTGTGTVQFSNLSDGTPIHATPQRRNGAFALAVNPRGDRLAIGFGGGEVDLWDSVMASRLRRFPYIHDDRGLGPVVFSPDGRWLLRQADTNIYVTDVRTGELVRTLSAPTPATLYSLAISPDGRWVAAGGAQSLAVFELATGRFVWSNNSQTFVDHVAFAPTGDRLVACSMNHNTRVYDARNGAEIRTISGPISPASIDFLDEFQVLLGGSDTLGLWDLRTGKLVRQYASRSTGAGVGAFTADRKWLVVGSDEGLMTLFDAKSGAKVTQFVAHDDDIRQVVTSRDDRFVYSTSFDGTIRVTPLDTLIQATAETDPRAMVWVADNSDWLAYSADGYFDASRRGGGLVAAINGFDGYRVDQLAVRNNRPDLTLSRLGMGSAPAISFFVGRYQQRLRRLGFAENSLSHNLSAAPSATIAELTRSGRTAKIRCRFAGNGRNLKRYFVFVNDVAVGDGEGTRLASGQAEVEVSVPLSAGRNKIELSVLNDVGVESFRDVMTTQVTEAAPGDLYYLGFGVSKYVDGRLDLKYADKDARDLGQTFERMRQGVYHRVWSQTLTDAQVTRKSIESAKSFLAQAKVDDTVVVFVAGHGVFGSGKNEHYYFMPHEADVGKIQETGVSFEVIEDLVTGIAPRRKLLLLDTCESGERDGEDEIVRVSAGRSRGLVARGIRPIVLGQGVAERGTPSQIFSQDRYIFNDLSRRSGTIVFSASHGAELSYEDDRLQNGIFTYELLQALSSSRADGDHNGAVTTDELRSYVTQAVATRTDGLQNPTVDRDNLEALFDFPVGLGKPSNDATGPAAKPSPGSAGDRNVTSQQRIAPQSAATTIRVSAGVTTVILGKDGRPKQVILPPAESPSPTTVPRPSTSPTSTSPAAPPPATANPSASTPPKTRRRQPQVFKSVPR